jgi:hypothetical protein
MTTCGSTIAAFSACSSALRVVEPQLAQDQFFALQLCGADAAPPGEAMARRAEDDDRMLAERHRDEALVGKHLREHADIGAIIEESIEHVLGVAGADRDLDAGVTLIEGDQHLRDVTGTDGSDAQVSGAQLARIAEQLHGVGLEAEYLVRDLQQPFAELGQSHPPAGPMEKLHLVAFLQRLHLGRDRRLAHMQALGGAREAAGRRHGMKGAELRQSHRADSALS